MKNMNPMINTGKHMLQNKLSQICFNKLNGIKADELGRTEINNIEEKCKQSMEDELSSYLNGGDSYCLPFHIGLQALEKLFSDPKIDEKEVIDELSLLCTTISLYNLSEFYKNSLLSSDRNNHHAYMLKAVNSFAHTFYSDHMLEGLEFYIVSSCCIMDYEIDFLLYWLEFATLETKVEWTI